MPRTGHSLPSLGRLLLNNNQLCGSFWAAGGHGKRQPLPEVPAGAEGDGEVTCGSTPASWGPI